MFSARSLVLAALVATSFVSASPAMLDKRAHAAPPASTTTYCNVANAQMPTASPTPLPPPSAGLTLAQVAIGRGTQNYTCADSTANSVPVPVGANATLFNATCIAGPFPELLSQLPGIAIKYAVPESSTPLSPANLFLSGLHYFTDLTTPFFNLDTDAHSWGTVACKKLAAEPAPDPTTDVPWLKLQSKASDGCTISEIYRVNTVGGQPPKTCEGQPANIYVQYAAEYWFWGGGGSGYGSAPPS